MMKTKIYEMSTTAKDQCEISMKFPVCPVGLFTLTLHDELDQAVVLAPRLQDRQPVDAIVVHVVLERLC